MQQKKRSLPVFLIAPLLAVLLMAFYATRPVEYQVVCKIPLEGGTFSTDNLQNIYVLSGSVLKKYDGHGKLLFQHDDKTYGNITYVDVNDPLKVMVFYKYFPELVFLDNTLSINGTPISPGSLGFPLTTLACGSHDNGAWLYDEQGVQLVRIDINQNVVQKTGNLTQTLGIGVNPNYLMEYNSYVYLNDTAHGILIFDQYGTYYKTIPIIGLTTFEIRGDDLFYNKGNTIHSFHMKTVTEDVTKAPDSLASMVRVEKNMLFEASKDTLKVYITR